jgi:hypothetical protein
MSKPSSDVAFTPAVKAIQEKRGSRRQYARMEERGGWQTAITPDLAGFLGEVRSFYLATASTVAARRAFCGCSTRARWGLPTSRATGSTSPPAT